MKMLHSQNGYTLIELLLYVAIVGTLLTSITYFFGMMASARVKNQSITEVNDQGTAAIELIAQTVRNGSSISAPAAGATGSSLTTVVPTGTLSPTIFDVSGTTLRIKEGTASPIPLTNSRVQVSNLTVKNLTRSGTSGIVQISLTLTHTNANNQQEFEFQKTFTTSAEVGW